MMCGTSSRWANCRSSFSLFQHQISHTTQILSAEQCPVGCLVITSRILNTLAYSVLYLLLYWFKSVRPQKSDTALRSCVKVVVAVLGTPSVIVVMIYVGITQQWTWPTTHCNTWTTFHVSTSVAAKFYFLTGLSISLNHSMTSVARAESAPSTLSAKRHTARTQSLLQLSSVPTVGDGWRWVEVRVQRARARRPIDLCIVSRSSALTHRLWLK